MKKKRDYSDYVAASGVPPAFGPIAHLVGHGCGKINKVEAEKGMKTIERRRKRLENKHSGTAKSF